MIALFPSRTVAIEIFGFAVHWYGLLYLAGFITAWFLLPRLQRLRELHLTQDEWSSILSYAVAGVILGGRLGYVLLYAPAYYLSNPLKIVAVWEGGMSSHGGFIGVTIALLIALRHRPDIRWKMADVVTVPVAIGLALGRIGNFINQELYGTVTDLPWGMVFDGADGPRHPTQLYAVINNLIIAGICYWHLRSRKNQPYGRTCGIFLALYGIQRFLVEYVRVPSHSVIDLGLFTLTRGQLYSIPVVVIGVWLIARRRGK